MKEIYEELKRKKDELYDMYYFNANIDFTKIKDSKARKIEYSFERIMQYTSYEVIDKELVEKELELIKENIELLIEEYCKERTYK